MKNFKIEKNIEIPPKVLPRTVFPLEEMEIGDSFFVRCKDFKAAETQSLKGKIYARIKKYLVSIDDFEKKFRVVRYREDKGCRVFRVK